MVCSVPWGGRQSRGCGRRSHCRLHLQLTHTHHTTTCLQTRVLLPTHWLPKPFYSKSGDMCSLCFSQDLFLHFLTFRVCVHVHVYVCVCVCVFVCSCTCQRLHCVQSLVKVYALLVLGLFAPSASLHAPAHTYSTCHARATSTARG